jgi:hypothetical protein
VAVWPPRGARRAGILAGLLVALLWLPAAVPAQSSPLRGGEHEDFTRLTLRIGSGTGWQLHRVPGGYALELGAAAPQPDLSETWRRIGRTRLAGVERTRRGLAFRLACDPCHADARLFDGDLLAIDFRDGPPPAGSPFERSPAEAPLPLPRAAAARHGLPLVPPGASGGFALMPGNALDAALAQAEPALDPPAPSAADARRALEAAIARAAERGLVEPVGPLPVPDGPLAAAPGLSIRVPGLAGEVAARPPDPCDAAPELDLPSWGGAAPFAEEIGAARRAIAPDLERVDDEAVEALARLYVYYGLGREAEALLAELAPGLAARSSLAGLARIVDGGLPEPPSPFAGLWACASPAALWAMLGQELVPPGEEIERAAVLRSFQALPLHLRRALAPALARRFLAAGELETAGLVVTTATRNRPADGEIGLALAEIEAARGALPAAEARLGGLTADPGQTGAEALAALLEMRHSEARPVPEEMAQLAAARAFELQGTPLGGRLQAASVLALAVPGRFAEAARELERAGARRGAEQTAALRAELVRALVARAPDLEFLRLAMAGGVYGTDGLPADLVAAIAGRRADLGFPAEPGPVTAASPGIATAPPGGVPGTTQSARTGQGPGAGEGSLGADGPPALPGRGLGAASSEPDGSAAAAPGGDAAPGPPLPAVGPRSLPPPALVRAGRELLERGEAERTAARRLLDP